MESKRKRFGFLKERFIGSPRLNTVRGLLRLVSKFSDITCTCLALDLAITACAGHFTDSVRKNLAAVKKKNDKIAQNHIAVFSTRFYHIFTCIHIVFAQDKDHISKVTNTSTFSET